jgi:pilus assembly protein Flp/PilA
MTTLSRFMKDETGATAIEYGLIAAIVGVGLIASLRDIKSNLSRMFENVNSGLSHTN